LAVGQAELVGRLERPRAAWAAAAAALAGRSQEGQDLPGGLLSPGECGFSRLTYVRKAVSMAWTFAANCHAQIWKNNAAANSPPVGAATYDGVAQLLTPALKSPSANPWRGRIVLPATAIVLLGSDINAAGTTCWLAIVDDQTTQVWGYWKIVDLSLAEGPWVGHAGQYTTYAIFLDFILQV